MRADKKLWRNRKERKEWARRLQSEDPGLEVVHPHAAGIDVGKSAHYVAVRPERDPQPVRRFECFTTDLRRLAEWLQSYGVKTVAMQSTGVYWIPLYEILEERGLEVYLVNARHTKNLPGRKSDVQESQWLLKLHTHGLLNNSFQPPAEIRVVRRNWGHRGETVGAASPGVHGKSHCPGDSGRRTRSEETGRTEPSSDSGRPRRDRQKSGGKLAARVVV